MPELAIDPGNARDETVGFDRANNRTGFGIYLMDLAVAILAYPERAFRPRESRVGVARGGNRGHHSAGYRIDLLDFLAGYLEQVLAIEGCSCMRGHIDAANGFAACRIHGIQFVAAGKPHSLAVKRYTMHLLDAWKRAIFTYDFC